MKNMTVESILKRFNNYTLGIFLAVLAGIGVGLWALLSVYIPTGSVVLSTALYRLLLATFGLLTASQIVSGVGYIFTTTDIAFNEKTLLHKLYEALRGLKNSPGKFVKERRTEFIGLLIGIAAAIALSIYLATTGGTGILVNIIPGLGFVVTLIANISALAGLFSRIGRCIDHIRKNGKEKVSAIFRAENINYVLGVIAGVLIGAVIVGVCLGLFGVTSAMVPGAAPLWIGGIVFALGTISSCASASGYIARIFDFFLGHRTLGLKRSADDQGIKSRLTPETIGTMIGVTVGLALGIALFATGVAGIPFFGSGLPLMAAGFIVIAACVSGFGGLGNRVGALVKRLAEKKDTPIGANEDHTKSEQNITYTLLNSEPHDHQARLAEMASTSQTDVTEFLAEQESTKALPMTNGGLNSISTLFNRKRAEPKLPIRDKIESMQLPISCSARQ